MLSSFHSAALSRQIVPIIYISSKHPLPFPASSDDNPSGDPTSINAGAGVKNLKPCLSLASPGLSQTADSDTEPGSHFPPLRTLHSLRYSLALRSSAGGSGNVIMCPG
jgi:hypothetical protein